MDINDLRGLSTLFMLIAFVGLCFWAYSSKRKKTFEDAAGFDEKIWTEDRIEFDFSHGSDSEIF